MVRFFQIRIQSNRAFVRLNRLLVGEAVVVRPQNKTAGIMTFGQVGIKRERFFYGDLGVLVQLFLLGIRGEVVRLDTIGPSQLSIGRCKVWIGLDGLLQQSDRAFVALAILAVGVQLAAQIIVICRRVLI